MLQNLLLSNLKNKSLKNGFPLVINYGSGKGISLLDFMNKEWIRLNAKGKIINHSSTFDDKEVISIVSDNSIY